MIRDRAEAASFAASALLTTAAAVWLLAHRPQPRLAPVLPADPPMRIALEPPPPLPPPPPPAPAAPQAAAETPMAAPAPVEKQAALPLPPPRRQHHRTPKPAARMPPSDAATAEDAPSRPVTASAPLPAARPAQNPTADALYTGLVHATIERHKRNPDSPAYRMMRPHGTVTVAFTLSRAGVPSDLRVSAGSGAAILDAQALLILGACRFAPMPDAAFAGSPSHPFLVEITFPPFGSTD